MSKITLRSLPVTRKTNCLFCESQATQEVKTKTAEIPIVLYRCCDKVSCKALALGFAHLTVMNDKQDESKLKHWLRKVIRVVLRDQIAFRRL